LVLWHRDAASGGGGIGSFLFDVVLIGLVLCAPLAILALVLTDRAVAFLGGLIVVLLGNVFYGVSQRRNGKAADAGDAAARARVDRWKKWQKKWTR
jgi:membrane protein YqaA with SNARE-associated domain